MYDIDGDGIKELVVNTGRYHMGLQNHIYTIQNGQAVYLVSPNGGYSEYYGRPAGGLYVLSLVNGGHGSVGILTLSNGTLNINWIVDDIYGTDYEAYMPDAINIENRQGTTDKDLEYFN